jgi:hypothetical protein
VPSPLAELYIGTVVEPQISNVALERLSTVFVCQPLRKLILFDVPSLDMPLFEGIIATFPQLKELQLITSGFWVPSPGGLVGLSVYVRGDIY